MGFSAGKNLENNINTTEAQTLSNKTLDNSNLIDGSPIENSTITGASIESPERVQLKQYDDLASAQADISNRNGGELIYVNDIKKTFQVNDDGLGTKTLAEISGGQGGVNYIENSDFEQGVDGYTDDTNFTISQTDLVTEVAKVLRGTASAKLSKAAVDASNEEISVPFTVSRADLAKKLTISFEYDASDPNYADNDILIGVRQDPNGTPSIIRINGEDLKGGKGTHYAQFQTDASQTEYELFFKVNSTNSSAYDVIIDDVKVGPREVVKGAVMTDSTILTGSDVTDLINLTGWQGARMEYRRVGERLVGSFYLRKDGVAGAGATELRFTLPDNLHGVLNTEDGFTKVGNGDYYNDSNGSFSVNLASSTEMTLWKPSAIASYKYSDITQTHYISFNFDVKIQGWSSNAVTSEDLGGREIACSYTSRSGATVADGDPVIFETIDYDTTSSYNPSTGVYTVPESGLYNILATVRNTSTSTLLGIEVNGTQVHRTYENNTNTGSMHINATLKVKKGDTIEITNATGASRTFTASINYHRMSIAKLASPQTILETETVAARYTTNAGTNISPSIYQILKYEDIDFDTHNMYDTSTGILTIPITGKYNISAKAMLAGLNADQGEMSLAIYVNGIKLDEDYNYISRGSLESRQVVTTLDLEKNDEVTIRLYQTNGAGRVQFNQNSYNTFSIARIK